MSPSLDPLSLQFAIWARGASGLSLDIGCGDGLAAAQVLARGGRVLAVDPDSTLLGRLVTRIPREQRPRLKVQLGSLPDIDFDAGCFSAVHAARVLHQLPGPELERSLRKFFHWLQPLGKLFISVLTSHGQYWKPLQDRILRRTTAGFRWPGYLQWGVESAGDRSVSIHLLDESVLRRELEATGFAVEELGCYPLPWDTDQVCCAIIARRNS